MDPPLHSASQQQQNADGTAKEAVEANELSGGETGVGMDAVHVAALEEGIFYDAHESEADMPKVMTGKEPEARTQAMKDLHEARNMNMFVCLIKLCNIK